MKELTEIIKNNMKQYTMIIVLVCITAFFQFVTHGILLLPQNVANLVQQNAYVVILAVGMMICILTGGNIDLSVGSLVAFVGAMCGSLMIGKGMNMWLVILLCFGVAILAGAWHGFWIAQFGIPAFIATLSGMLMFRGLTYYILKGQTYFSYPEEFLALTTGFIKDYIGGEEAGIHVTTIVIGMGAIIIYIISESMKRRQQKKYGVSMLSVKFFISKLILISAVILSFSVILAMYKGMPVVLVPVAVIVIVYSFIMNNTVGGRYVYALGGNQKAAHLSGIHDRKVLFITYVNMAFLAAIAGLVFTARLNAASPKSGESFELDAIAACYIGGASATGGVGTIMGALIGALVMGLLNNGMSILGVEIDIQMVVKGLVLLLAVVIDMIQKNRARG